MGTYINCLEGIIKDDEEIKVELINKQEWIANKSEINKELNKQNNSNIHSIENENMEAPENEEILNNYILSEIYIEDSYINKYIKIINSYENFKIGNNANISENDYINYYNEKEIKENCTIEIDNQKINFNYYHKFYKKGNYSIKYTFKKKITKMNYLFANCMLITKIDLSNFNTENAINMRGMFYGCSSLENVNLSNLKSKNFINMSEMFYSCDSLKSLNLTNFNIQNVTNMSKMFYECKSLTNIDLSNFRTQNVTNMSNMFYECSSLKNIDISKFNVKNVSNMNKMFHGCRSLLSIDLSNFNAKNVTDMSKIFCSCE